MKEYLDIIIQILRNLLFDDRGQVITLTFLKSTGININKTLFKLFIY